MKRILLFAFFLFHGFGATAQIASDAGVTAVTAPTSPILSGVSRPVTVNLRNFSANLLTTVTLNFSVNGAVQPAYSWSGSLAANGTTVPVTIGNFTFSPGNHTVKAWTSNPNGTLDGNHANDTTTINLSTCSALAGTYTINKNAGTSATNFQSFAAAVQALNNCGISGPVVINVNNGPYEEALTLSGVNGASATNTITINGNGNMLSNPATTGDALKLDGAGFFRFNNLLVENKPNASGGAVIALVNGSQNNIFSGCTFTHSTTITTASWVVNLQAGSRSNTFLNNTLIGANYSINNTGTASAPNSNNQFTGNVIKDFYFTGIQAGNAPGTLIESNDISRPTRTTTSTFQGMSIGSGCTGLVISKNRIHNTHDAIALTAGNYFYGIYLSANGVAGAENIVKNNAIYNINIPGGSVYGFYNSGGSHTYFYHNTFAADNPNISYSTLRGIYFGGAFPNTRFINNNFSLSSPATSKHAVYLGATGISLNSNRNNIYVGSTGNVGYYTNNIATLADWKLVNSSAYDQNSVSADPQYINLASGNLKPNNTILNDIGLALPAVTEDITGAARNATTPDPGAFEFTPVANDASITAYVSPASPVAPNLSTPIFVTLKNFGTSPLTAVAINWTVNGTAQTVYNWTGNLASNQAVNVTIGNYTFPAGSYTLNICTASPNGVTDPNPGNDCQPVSLVACNSFAGNYTINKNAPASATNFVSFASAINMLTGCGINAPVIFDVVAGSGPYNEIVSLGNINGASATNTITFNGNGNVLTSPAATENIVLKLDGAKFFRFNNLKIEHHANAASGAVVWMKGGAQQNFFDNCEITHSKSGNSPSYGVYLQSGTSNNTFTNNTVTGAYYGFYNIGMVNLPNSNNQFTGNLLKDQYVYGIYNLFSPGTLLEGNDISRPTRTNGSDFFGIYLSGSAGVTISKNRIHNTHDAAATTVGTVYGIYYNADGTSGNENIVKNNIIYNINNTAGTFTGIYHSGNNTFYYHNTVSADNPAVYYDNARGINIAASVNNVKFINNIISLACSATVKHGIYLGNFMPPLVSNYNNFYVPNGNVGYLNNDISTLALWQTANNNAYDQNSYSLNPVFANPVTGNLRPTAPTADNLGQVLPAVTDDINGNARNTTTPDLGAVEFTINPNDVGIVSVSGPVTNGCGLSSAETITVTIRNYGTAVQTSIPVSYFLNSGAAVNETFTGTIAAGATATYTFTAKANLSAAGSYTISAQTMLPGDAVVGNNDTSLVIVNPLVTSFPVTFDFETATTGINMFRKVLNTRSAITEAAGASNGATSSKGVILDGVENPAWVSPAGITSPWTINPENFAALFLCISTSGMNTADSLKLTFDLKQLFKDFNTSTNFRVTVNGTQVGPTYRPPFGGGTPVWQKIEVDLTSFLNQPVIQIGFESSVKEAYDNGNGIANLIDNIAIVHVAANTTGVKNDLFAQKISVYPNPSNGLFKVEFPEGKTYVLTVSDLTGKVIKTQAVNADHVLDMHGAAKGVYLLKITGAEGSAVRKLVIE